MKKMSSALRRTLTLVSGCPLIYQAQSETDFISEVAVRNCDKPDSYEVCYVHDLPETWATGDREIAYYLYDPQVEQVSSIQRGAGI